MENNQNKKPDAFSEIIRQKLENHRLLVDTDCWDEIEARMNAKKKKRIIPFWFWFSGGAAVATFALLFVFRSFMETPVYTAKSVHRNMLRTEEKTKPMSACKADTAVTISGQKSNRKVVNQYKPVAKTGLIADEELKVIQPVTKDSTEHKETWNETTKNILPENKGITQMVSGNKDSTDSKIPKEVFPGNMNNEPKVIRVSKSKNAWMLAAAFGSGSPGLNTGSGNSDIFLSVGNTGIVNATPDNTTILTPNDFSDITHYAPVSFGLTVRKNLDKVWSVESGLVYTYLLSTYEKQIPQHYDAGLKLHYLGVPLNVVTRVWRKARWETYLSAGGMMEKGIRSIYVQNEYSGNQIITTRVETKIDGLQWSVDAGLGVSYKLQHHFGICIEPKISYYLDNNQPMSARTDQPVVISLNAGLRYEF
jgi:hypothetical protein